MTEAEPPHFDYPELLHAALLGVVREVLGRAAAAGLPGDHHFYLTFGTKEPGVGLSAPLAKQHPEEMTIVLQHQYWNLSVDDGGFSVTLRFGGKPERLVVPWEALRSFVDPSVGFGLRLSPAAEDKASAGPAASREPGGAPVAEAIGSPPASGSKIVDFGSYKRRDDEPEGA